MSDLVKVKAYFVVRRETSNNVFAMHSGPFNYYGAVEQREKKLEEDHYFYDVIYTDIVGELLG